MRLNSINNLVYEIKNTEFKCTEITMRLMHVKMCGFVSRAARLAWFDDGGPLDWLAL